MHLHRFFNQNHRSCHPAILTGSGGGPTGWRTLLCIVLAFSPQLTLSDIYPALLQVNNNTRAALSVVSQEVSLFLMELIINAKESGYSLISC